MEITCDGYIIILDKSVSLAVILNDSGDEIHRFNTKKHISEPSDFVIHGKSRSYFELLSFEISVTVSDLLSLSCFGMD